MTSKELEQEIKDLEMEYKILNQSDLAITDYITYARRHNQLFSKIDLQKRRLDKVTIEELKEQLKKLKKENSALRSYNKALETWNDIYSDNWNAVKERNEKLEKAIEILKNGIQFGLSNLEEQYKGKYEYKVSATHRNYFLTKEEYELLKEVFGCD